MVGGSPTPVGVPSQPLPGLFEEEAIIGEKKKKKKEKEEGRRKVRIIFSKEFF